MSERGGRFEAKWHPLPAANDFIKTLNNVKALCCVNVALHLEYSSSFYISKQWSSFKNDYTVFTSF